MSFPVEAKGSAVRKLDGSAGPAALKQRHYDESIDAATPKLSHWLVGVLFCRTSATHVAQQAVLGPHGEMTALRGLQTAHPSFSEL